MKNYVVTFAVDGKAQSASFEARSAMHAATMVHVAYLKSEATPYIMSTEEKGE